MKWSEVGNVETNGTRRGFLDSVEIWRKKPHVVNRRLVGAELLWSAALSPNPGNDDDDDDNNNDDDDDSDDRPLDGFVTNLLTTRDLLGRNCSEIVGLNGILGAIKQAFEGIYSPPVDEFGRWTITVRCLLYKNLKKIVEVIIIDNTNMEAVFLPFFETREDTTSIARVNDFGYKLWLDERNKKIVLFVCDTWNADLDLSSGCSYSTAWLSDILLSKLARWSEENTLNTEVTSLKLVNIERYSQVYNELKQKYGKYFVQIWPEQTDPSKFVYEDIGIAAYLLVLWEMERRQKGLTARQSFVDIGCGNGFLVYLLTSEGHPGFGIDIRRRKIWDLLSETADLKEYTINPSDDSLFPNHDWLLGNHSDELTPWIPVIAARSRYNCRYFLLPCCAWDFTEKFSGKGPKTSQYHSYLEFVGEVGEVCGFEVERDVLRIPSTKRACFIGMERSYQSSDGNSIDARISDYIRERSHRGSTKTSCFVPFNGICGKISSGGHSVQNISETGYQDETNGHGLYNGNDLESGKFETELQENVVDTNIDPNLISTGLKDDLRWAETFRPRSAIEKPRNAICLQQSVKDLITVTVLHKILSTTNSVTLSNGHSWNQGGILSLNEASQLFVRDVLLQLKSECGGLQTLLKNCPDVFLVQNGNIGLRNWTTPDYLKYRASRIKKLPNSATRAEEMRKTKLCFFFQHHPDGCPLESSDCRFAHGSADQKL